jgi:hypothetical protein
MTISRMVRYSIDNVAAGVACGGHQGYSQPISRPGGHMQRQFFQVFRDLFSFIRGVIYIVFAILLGIDLNEVHTPIETGIAVAAALAALLLFDPLVEILLMASLIALVVAVAHGQCSPTTTIAGEQINWTLTKVNKPDKFELLFEDTLTDARLRRQDKRGSALVP